MARVLVHLDTGQIGGFIRSDIIVRIPEPRQPNCHIVAQPGAVPHIKRTKALGVEAVIAHQLNECHGGSREERVRLDDRRDGPEIVLGPRGCSCGPCKGTPHCVAIVWTPPHPDAGLQFRSGVRVAFQLGTHRQADLVRYRPDLVLNEPAQQVDVTPVGIHGHREAPGVAVSGQSISHSPDDVVISDAISLLVVHIQMLKGPLHHDLCPVGTVIVGLERLMQATGVSVRPTGQQMSPGDIRVVPQPLLIRRQERRGRGHKLPHVSVVCLTG